MKNWFRKLSVVSLFTLASLTTTSVIAPMNAQAAIGSIAWPLFPLMIVGAALEVTGAATSIAAIVEGTQDFRSRSYNLWGSALSQFFLGIIFLDEQSQTGTLQTITEQQAQQFGLSQSEMQAYNSAIENGELEEIIQQASQDLTPNSSHEQAKETMQRLLSQLPQDAHSGFTKIAQHLVSR